MHTWYVDYEHRGIADLVKPGELTDYWTITRINIPAEHRGHGYGSDLLRRILADADEEGVILALEVFPSGPLDYDVLEQWYGRYGFQMTSQGYLLRIPNLAQE